MKVSALVSVCLVVVAPLVALDADAHKRKGGGGGGGGAAPSAPNAPPAPNAPNAPKPGVRITYEYNFMNQTKGLAQFSCPK